MSELFEFLFQIQILNLILINISVISDNKIGIYRHKVNFSIP